MNELLGQRRLLAELVAAIWPPLLAADSESQRRKKLAVRGGQLALSVMVVATVVGTIIIGGARLKVSQSLTLAGAGLVYLCWSLHGIHRAVKWILWEGHGPPPEKLSTEDIFRVLPYFVIQLALAALVSFLGGQAGSYSVAWLVLLPPVAHAVILLPRIGVALVALAAMSAFVANIVWLYGWKSVPGAAFQFSFALIFTVVFTLLAVSSEIARAHVQWLASELTEANQRLREHAVRAEELAATRERNRLAREIHDNLGHCLTVVNMQIEAARALCDREPARAREALEKAQSLTQQSLAEIRNSVAALRTSPLENKPLVEALQQIVAECRAAGMVVEMQVCGEVHALSPPAELTLYRAGQEGLTNVRKHSRAARAELILDFRAPGMASLSIADDGVGMAGDGGLPDGFGMLGLRERTQLLGGSVRVKTAAGKGFVLEVKVPA